MEVELASRCRLRLKVMLRVMVEWVSEVRWRELLVEVEVWLHRRVGHW